MIYNRIQSRVSSSSSLFSLVLLGSSLVFTKLLHGITCRRCSWLLHLWALRLHLKRYSWLLLRILLHLPLPKLFALPSTFHVISPPSWINQLTHVGVHSSLMSWPSMISCMLYLLILFLLLHQLRRLHLHRSTCSGLKQTVWFWAGSRLRWLLLFKPSSSHARSLL